jgi:hypothetical protein
MRDDHLTEQEAWALACKMLDLWKKDHVEIPNGPNYPKLEHKLGVLATEAGFGSSVDIHTLRHALETERKSRKWPDPRPDRLEPSIEGAIMSLLASARRPQKAWWMN